MASVQFQVVHTRKQARPRKDVVLLEPSPWDDYGWQCTFHLLVAKGDAHQTIGEWKIIDAEQPDAKRTELPPRFSQLPPRYVSLGQQLAAYHRLSALQAPIAKGILAGLRDLVYRPRPELHDVPWFTRTLGRSAAALAALERGGDVLAEAKLLATPRRARPLPDTLDLRIRARLRGFASKHELSLSFSRAAREAGLRRMVVLVGPNGSGKTQLLAALARALSGLEVKDVEVVPEQPFTQVIAVSYGAFDHFVVPQLPDVPIGYVYCGLRVPPDYHTRRLVRKLDDTIEDVATEMPERDADIVREAWQLVLRKAEVGAPSHDGRRRAAPNDPATSEKRIITLDVDHAIEATVACMTSMAESRAEKARYRLWREAMKIIGLDALCKAVEGGAEKAQRVLRDRLSAGQKLVALTLTNVAVHLRPGSIVLHDEPETHLHPNLLSALLRALRMLLHHFDSYAIVATHSVIPPQEMPSSNLIILDESGIRASHPVEQCFASTLDEITRVAFRTGPRDQNFRTILKELRQRYDADEILDLLGGEPGLGTRLLLAAQEP
jgi:ABC-type cobalamin/Fe3+-siderophores transport system ATPase subunit